MSFTWEQKSSTSSHSKQISFDEASAVINQWMARIGECLLGSTQDLIQSIITSINRWHSRQEEVREKERMQKGAKSIDCWIVLFSDQQECERILGVLILWAEWVNYLITIWWMLNRPGHWALWIVRLRLVAGMPSQWTRGTAPMQSIPGNCTWHPPPPQHWLP